MCTFLSIYPTKPRFIMLKSPSIPQRTKATESVLASGSIITQVVLSFSFCAHSDGVQIGKGPKVLGDKMSTCNQGCTCQRPEKKFYFIIFNPFLRICLLILEREQRGEREKETSVSCLSYASDQESNLQPRYVLWAGIEPTTFWYMGWHSNQWSRPARALRGIFKVHILQVQLQKVWDCEHRYVGKAPWGISLST